MDSTRVKRGCGHYDRIALSGTARTKVNQIRAAMDTFCRACEAKRRTSPGICPECGEPEGVYCTCEYCYPCANISPEPEGGD